MSDHDAQEVAQILDVVAEKVPALISELRNTLFSAEAGAEMGKAVGSFYRQLVDSGIPEGEALAMAKSYIGSLQGLMNQVKTGH